MDEIKFDRTVIDIIRQYEELIKLLEEGLSNNNERFHDPSWESNRMKKCDEVRNRITILKDKIGINYV
jgi:hypothetical protein